MIALESCSFEEMNDEDRNVYLDDFRCSGREQAPGSSRGEVPGMKIAILLCLCVNLRKACLPGRTV